MYICMGGKMNIQISLSLSLIEKKKKKWELHLNKKRIERITQSNLLYEMFNI